MFGRDSINGQGMQIIGKVHYSTKYNNAFWSQNSMTYGDGDGITYKPFSYAVDVVAHELTHGVTQYESSLVYSYEPGGLNEAMSDIFAACIEHLVYGKTQAQTWSVGEDLFFAPNKAVRSMADPTLYGACDLYRDRHLGKFNSTLMED
jgi:Zn-dependent metalloprotease